MAFDCDEYLHAKNYLLNQKENMLRAYFINNGLNEESTEAIIKALKEIPYHRKYPAYEPTILEQFVKALNLKEVNANDNYLS